MLAVPHMTTIADGAFLADDAMMATYELNNGWLHIAPASIGKQAFLGNSGMAAAGHAVPNRGLVGVLSAAPRRSKKGSSWLGMPPMPLRRAPQDADQSRTFSPPKKLRVARGADRGVPGDPGDGQRRAARAASSATWRALGADQLLARRAAAAASSCSPAGIVACLIATAVKWVLVGRFRVTERPLWSSFVWRNELADTFVEVLAVPWLIGSIGGTPLLPALAADDGREGRPRHVAGDILAAGVRSGTDRRRRHDQPGVRRADPPLP